MRCVLACYTEITERPVLPRKPGVFAYAASTLIARSLLLSPGQTAEQSMCFICIEHTYPRCQQTVNRIHESKLAGLCSSLALMPGLKEPRLLLWLKSGPARLVR